MKKEYHILNGDALKEQFPEDIKGTLIIARECLIEGNVDGDTFDSFFNNRAQFISKNYGDTKEAYLQNVKTEFQKILTLEPDSNVNLWFEDDLFCQVNFWFVIHLLSENKVQNNLFLVRPPKHTQYGFGGLNKQDLFAAYQNRTMIKHNKSISSLWLAYKNKNWDLLKLTAKSIEDTYPFILAAVQAQLDRLPKDGKPGRPTQTLQKIMAEQQTKDFKKVFKEFSKRESIYGFGDLQVKALFDQILKNQ